MLLVHGLGTKMPLTKLTLLAHREPFSPRQATLLSHIYKLIAPRYIYTSFFPLKKSALFSISSST